MPLKLIIDSDFATFNDDGQALALAASLHRQGALELIGLTLVSGNNWLAQCTVDALRAIERLGLAGEVPVSAGANRPLLHDPRAFAAEQALFGVGEAHRTAFHRPEPGPNDLVAPFDGFAQTATLGPVPAACFIADAVRRYPGEVTLLAIGPMTNLALALRLFPDIGPLIGRVVMMGGAFFAAGNTTPAAEMNVWFDPEAARIVLREGLPLTIVPLDATRELRLGAAAFDGIVAQPGVVPELFRRVSRLGQLLAADRAATHTSHDSVALAVALDPGLVTKDLHAVVDVDIGYGPGYGRTLAYTDPQPTDLLKPARIVLGLDRTAFTEFYVRTMCSPDHQGTHR